MPTNSLTPYYNNTTQYTFVLVSTSDKVTSWKVSGRPLAQPFSLSIEKKIGATGQKTNDHVVVKVSKTDANSTSAELATCNVSMDISIPRDASAIAASEVIEMLGVLSSLLNDSTALAATTANRTALVEGRDL